MSTPPAPPPTVITRFAPSPTGNLHLGGARTALFNWLYARHMGGQFLLRIEDTDRARSTPEATQQILDSLTWLGLDWDESPTFQSKGLVRHQEIGRTLLEQDDAYWCYMSPEEVTEAKEKAGRGQPFTSPWRDKDPKDAPQGIKPALRLKTPQSGQTTLKDQVQGDVRVQNTTLEDFILLRSDGTPTYMLSVVVDDHDMGITHVIRGDDHLTNAFKQIQIYKAMGWEVPTFAHIPLIHDTSGKKMSKRHGNAELETHIESGILPEAMRNALLRLGWGHGNDEIISTEEAIHKFTLSGVGRSPARFDPLKLAALNAHYLREMDDETLLARLEEAHLDAAKSWDAMTRTRLLRGLSGLKVRAKAMDDLWESTAIYTSPTLTRWDEAAQKQLTPDARTLLERYSAAVKGTTPWNAETLEAHARNWTAEQDLGLGKLAAPLRAALTGQKISPGIFEIMEVLGPALTLMRLQRQPS